GRALSAFTETEKTASRRVFSAAIHLPDGSSLNNSGFASTQVMWMGCSRIVARRAFGHTSSCTSGELHCRGHSTMPVFGVTFQLSSENSDQLLPTASLKPPQTRSCAEPG